MLKDCKICPYYVHVIQLGEIQIHHYCKFFQLPYVFLKNHKKLKECPDTTAKAVVNPQETPAMD